MKNHINRAHSTPNPTGGLQVALRSPVLRHTVSGDHLLITTASYHLICPKSNSHHAKAEFVIIRINQEDMK